MCGIAGWRGWKPSKTEIAWMLMNIEHRGTDATGYGTLTPKGPIFAKGPEKASKFVKMLEENHPEIGNVGILHTRSRTVGSERNNDNNHPIVYNDVMAVHNGSMYQIRRAYGELGIEPIAEVDSAIIAAAFGKLGPREGLDFLQKNTPGIAAVAALFPTGELVLARSGKPLYVGKHGDNGMAWSSEAWSAADAVRDRDGWATIRDMMDNSFEIYDSRGRLIDEGVWMLPVPLAGDKGTNWITPTASTSKPMGFQPGVADPRLPAAYQPANSMPLPANQMTLPATSSISSAAGRVETINTALGQLDYIMIPEDQRHENICDWGNCMKYGKLVVLHGEKKEWTALCKIHAYKYIQEGKRTIPTPVMG